MKKISLLCCFLLSFHLFAQETKSPIVINALYIGDYFSNFYGGIKTGQTYLGLLDFGIGLRTEDAKLWKNGEFYVQIENTHGGSPSGDYLGDIQVASFIDNGDFTYMYEFWYQQQIGNLTFKIGLQDLNSDFHVSDYGGLYLNSSFGIMPPASVNMPVPIFPLTAQAIQLKYDFSDKFSLLAGVWDGDPGDFENNQYNVDWTLDKNEGFLYACEGQFIHEKGFLKLGALYHSGEFINLANTANITEGNLQFHFIADQKLIDKPDGEKGALGAFVQIGYLPDNQINPAPFYIGGGLNLSGLFSNSNDVLGISIASANHSKKLLDSDPNLRPHETAIELTYAITIWDYITFQPDLQYIINPGANESLKNAFCGFFRFTIEL